MLNGLVTVAGDAAAGDPANANASIASCLPVQASEQDDQGNDLLDQEIEEYLNEACAAGRFYLIV